jgi:hyperosmotically inducible protein
MTRPLLIAIITAALAAGQAPDNSKTNQRDRSSNSVTPDQQQKTGKSDTELVRKIRQSVYADKSLSTYAHNVKIMVQDGRVTLRGPVRTQTERDSIQQKASSIAGAENVSNQLEIAEKNN